MKNIADIIMNCHNYLKTVNNTTQRFNGPRFTHGYEALWSKFTAQFCFLSSLFQGRFLNKRIFKFNH